MKKLDDPSVLEAVAKALELAELTCPDTMVPKTYYDHLAQAAITAIREALQLTEDEAWNSASLIHKRERIPDGLTYFEAGFGAAYRQLGLIKGEEQQ